MIALYNKEGSGGLALSIVFYFSAANTFYATEGNRTQASQD
jgi:hypothetical protein